MCWLDLSHLEHCIYIHIAFFCSPLSAPHDGFVCATHSMRHTPHVCCNMCNCLSYHGLFSFVSHMPLHIMSVMHVVTYHDLCFASLPHVCPT